jgi:hypothetical protein
MTSVGSCMATNDFVCDVPSTLFEPDDEDKEPVWFCGSDNTGCARGYAFDEDSKNCEQCASHCNDPVATCTSSCVTTCKSGYYMMQMDMSAILALFGITEDMLALAGEEMAIPGVCLPCPDGCACNTTAQTSVQMCSTCDSSTHGLNMTELMMADMDKSVSLVPGLELLTPLLKKLIPNHFAKNATNDHSDHDHSGDHSGGSSEMDEMDLFGALMGDGLFCAPKCLGLSMELMECDSMDEEEGGCGSELSTGCCKALSNFYGAGCYLDSIDDQARAMERANEDAPSTYLTKYYESAGQAHALDNDALFATVQACEAAHDDEECNSTEVGALYTAECTTPIVTATLNFALTSDGNIAISDNEAAQIAQGLIPTVADALGANETDVEVSSATYTPATTKASSGTLSAEFDIKAASSSVTAASVKTALEAVPAANYTAAILASNVAGVPDDVGVVATAEVEVTSVQTPTQSGSGFNTFSVALFALVAALFW